MIITLRPAGAEDDSQDLVLAAGSVRSSTSPLGPADASTSVNVQVAETPIIGAMSTLLESRGNRSGSFSFRTSREFDSTGDAGRFLLLHGMTLPAEGTLIVDHEDAEPLVLLHSACVRSIGPFQQRGVSVDVSYTFSYSLAETEDDATAATSNINAKRTAKRPAQEEEEEEPDGGEEELPPPLDLPDVIYTPGPDEEPEE